MLFEQHLIQLFGTLPYLPKAEIIKHLDTFNLHRASVISQNWDGAIREYMKKVVLEKRRDYDIETQLFMKIVTKEQAAELILLESYSYGDTWEMLSIDLAVSQSSSLVLRGKRSIISCYGSFQKLKQGLLETVSRLKTVFPSELAKIDLNFDHGFSLDFLKELNIVKVSWMTLEAEKVRVNGEKLEKLLSQIKISAKLQLNVNTVRSWKGGEYLLKHSIHLNDSRWMTGDLFVKNFKSHYGYFNRCQLTARDCNRFFKRWKTGAKCMVVYMEFHFEKPVNLKEVVKGLDAKPWDPKVRSRKINWSLTAVDKLQIHDLADGLDITTESGYLATILLSGDGKLLRFYDWWQGRFPLEEMKKMLTKGLRSINKNLKMNCLEEEERKYLEQEKQRDLESVRILNREMKNK